MFILHLQWKAAVHDAVHRTVAARNVADETAVASEWPEPMGAAKREEPPEEPSPSCYDPHYYPHYHYMRWSKQGKK